MERDQTLKKLQEIVGEPNVLWKDVDLAVFEYDAGLDKEVPGFVVFTRTAEEVAQVVRFLHGEGISFVARGSGTNLSGGTIPLNRGVVIELSRMNRILEIDLPNERAMIEPGVYNLTLQNALAPLGYYYAPDPASQKVSTLGGNFGENAGGPHCLKYGVTSNHILGAEVVWPNGEKAWLGSKAVDPPGPDLLGLLVGSEGTLGIATKILVRIMRSPERVLTMLAIFKNLEDAGQTVSDIISEGIIPATLEIMDNMMIRAVEESMHAGYPLDAEAVLIIELDGLSDGMEEQAQRILEICGKNGVVSTRRAKDAAERADLWAGRRGAFGAVARLAPSYLVCDGTVPRTKLPAALSAVKKVGQKYNLAVGNVFHAGDGNLHPLILFDDRNAEEMERVHKAGLEILKICADLGGTISGEHGIGTEKLKGMPLVFRDSDLEMMQSLKTAIDPKGVCNPGKVIPRA
ncbi:MAG: FAD-binding protein [Deltaproteobacteria bacterium]|jgi:glycolate oxidase|nr:FAD-binding protein [Deltaproteobacteria bacterium]